MNTPKAKDFLSDVASYVGGKSKIAGKEAIIKLSSNENPYGASPKAVEAFEQCASLLHRYPEDGAASLRDALAVQHQIAAEQIICGAGSDDVIRMLVHAYAGVGDEVIHSAHGFAMYRIYAQQFGATPVAVPEQHLTADVDAIIAHVTERTRLVFLANPNNPTGTYLPQSEIARLRSSLREDIILVLDGAYAEYPQTSDYSEGMELVAHHSNTVCMRTFSKLYGLPALRIGWGYGSAAIIETLNKVRPPFNISQPAISAAIASLQDRTFVDEMVRKNTQSYQFLSNALAQLDIQIVPSHGNFLLMQLGNEQRKQSVYEHLQARGIIVRDVANYGLPSYLRVSFGTERENEAFISAMKDWVSK